MPFGSEQMALYTNRRRRILWQLRGDFHVGRWARYFYLKKALKKFGMQPAKILDAGCGRGQTSFFLERYFSGSAVDGIDFSSLEVEVCRKIAEAKRSRVNFFQWDLCKGPLLNSYQFIILNNVLSAVPDFETAMRHVAQSLAPGGWLVIQDMNNSFIHKNYGGGPAYEGQAHTGFSLDQLKGILNKEGLKTMHAEHAFGFWGDWAHRIFDKTRHNGFLLNAFFPVSLAAAYLDAIVSVPDGAGLFIVAKK